MKYQTSHKNYRLLVFAVGIIATVAYRIIIILNYYSSLLVAIAWYIGTIGFIWYFAHRYRVQDDRSDLIRDRGLARKVSAGWSPGSVIYFKKHKFKQGKMELYYDIYSFWSGFSVCSCGWCNKVSWLTGAGIVKFIILLIGS